MYYQFVIIYTMYALCVLYISLQLKHEMEEAQLRIPAWCGHCQSFIWGSDKPSQQAYQCTGVGCGIYIHKHCLEDYLSLELECVNRQEHSRRNPNNLQNTEAEGELNLTGVLESMFLPDNTPFPPMSHQELVEFQGMYITYSPNNHTYPVFYGLNNPNDPDNP